MDRPWCILVVDDNPDDIALLKAAFDSLGVRVEVQAVENGVQAFEYLWGRGRYRDRPAPDLVVLDVNLPVLTGKRVLREMKNEPDWAKIPVVMFSATAVPGDREECRKFGAALYVMKPDGYDGYVRAAADFLEVVTAA